MRWQQTHAISSLEQKEHASLLKHLGASLINLIGLMGQHTNNGTTLRLDARTRGMRMQCRHNGLQPVAAAQRSRLARRLGPARRAHVKRTNRTMVTGFSFGKTMQTVVAHESAMKCRGLIVGIHGGHQRMLRMPRVKRRKIRRPVTRVLSYTFRMVRRGWHHGAGWTVVATSFVIAVLHRHDERELCFEKMEMELAGLSDEGKKCSRKNNKGK